MANDAYDERLPPVTDVRPARPETEPDGATPRHGLVVVSTPIGNLGDLSPRARTVLGAADAVLCEDTRHTGRLLHRLGIRAHRLEALHEHNEAALVPGLVTRLADGALLALVSDAGTPLVSDPGFRLLRAAAGAGVAVTAVPGPSAILAALVLSGLPPHPFLFNGFPPVRQAARRAAFERLRALERAGLRATMLWHEAPHRVADTLADLAALFGPDRPAALSRELTKRFEQVRRGTLGALCDGVAADPPRGEITLVLGPASDDAAVADGASLDDQLRAALQRMSVRDAAGTVAAATGRSKRDVYARALQLDGADDRPPD